MKVLVGSQALASHLPNIRPRDTDYFCDHEIMGAETFYHPSLENYAWEGSVASLDELYTIKVSHSFWELRNGSWAKHMKDIELMQTQNAQFIPALYEVLYPIWEERYGKKKANLEAEPDEFFNSNITRIYEHDSIHASIAYYDEPLFKRILRDNHQIAVSKAKFEALSYEDKIKLVREEVFATALERKVIPGLAPYRFAYSWALQKTITSFSKGWFPLFIVLNIAQLRSVPFNYHEKMLANSDKLVRL